MQVQKRSLLLWLVATAVATSVATAAVGLAAGRVRQAPATVELVAGAEPIVVEGGGAAQGAQGTAGDGTDRAASENPAAPGTTPTAGPGDGTVASTPAPGPGTPAPDAAARDDDDPEDDDPEDDGPRPTPSPRPDGTSASGEQVRTVTVVGGTARFRAAGERVELVFATPSQGFQVRVDDDDEERVRVEFVSDDHASRVEAELDDDGLDIEVDERPDD